jgi:TolB-like protein
MRLFSELKRRNVLRMAALYVVAAWLVMQAADVLISLGSLPDRLGRMVLVVLAIGFPIALLISWFYELTPQGVVRDEDARAGAAAVGAYGRATDFVIIGILAAAVLLFAWDKWWPQGPPARSIAVLAFDNMSPDPEQEYFAQGISEEILNLLARIRQLKVSARTSSFSFQSRDVDIATIAAQLGVSHVLEGSVRRSGNTVRITAQLIDARDSSHVWSEVYEREMSAENLFLIQSEIARRIAGKLRTTLTDDEDRRLAQVPTDNIDAYTAYLFGRELLTDRKVDELARAVGQFALAIELDPDFAAPYAGLVDACSLYYAYSYDEVPDGCPPWRPRAFDEWDEADRFDTYNRELQLLARKAIELDPELGEAWISLAQVLGPSGPDDHSWVAEAEDAYLRGIELSPSFAQGYHWYASFLIRHPRQGPEEWREACEQRPWWPVLEQGLAIDPLSVTLRSTAASPRFAESAESALMHAHKLVELAPDAELSYRSLGEVYWVLEGRLDLASKWFRKAATFGWNRALTFRFAHLTVLLGDHEAAVAYIRAMQDRSNPQDAQRASEVGALTVHEGASYLYAGEYEKADAIFTALLQDVRQRPVVHGWSLDFLVGMELARNGPQQAIDRFAAIERDFGVAPEDSCLVDRSGEAYPEYCEAYLLPLMRSLGHDAWGPLFVSAAQDVLEQGWDYCDLRATPWRASMLAALGRNEEAIRAFVNIVEAGYRGNGSTDPMLDWQWTAYFSPWLHEIRSDPRFQAAVAVVEADMAMQRANVAAMEASGEIPTLESLYPELR